ncbi:MAG TPA: hypothetical protein VK841_06380 [Polyangiaceae bacterium]|jgi:hypothetical protein|nr:hypothetical protein [Polyangiaceae bacterium]
MRRLSRPACALLSSLVLITQTAVRPAHAQPAPPETAPVGGDVVKLLDGSVYRGTIIELVPRDHVTLRIATGEIRRFRMADVYYQGDEATQPGRTADAPQRQTRAPAARERGRAESDDGVPVHVVTNDPDLTLLVESSQATAGYWTAKGYKDLCIAPCGTALPVGTYHMALSSHGGRPVPVGEPVQLQGPSTLQAWYESRVGTRVAGIVITALGGAGGLALIIAGEFHMTNGDCTADSGSCTLATLSPDTGLMLAGVATLVVGTIIGVTLILQHDQATIQVVPLQEGLATPLTMNRKEAVAPNGAQGLGLRVAF